MIQFLIFQERIRQKKIAFEKRNKDKIRERLAKIAEMEEAKFRNRGSKKKEQNEYESNSDDESSSNRVIKRSKDGEDKNDQMKMIYSISSSSGKLNILISLNKKKHGSDVFFLQNTFLKRISIFEYSLST
jgi:hypothetical protein